MALSVCCHMIPPWHEGEREHACSLHGMLALSRVCTLKWGSYEYLKAGMPWDSRPTMRCCVRAQAKNLSNAKAQLETVMKDLALIKDFLTTTEVLP